MTDARVLAGRLADLLRREHAAMADFLVALADFDQRRSWLELGHSSLFYFLHRELGLSKGAAHYRKTAAELVQKFPEIVEPLRDGRLCITSIVHLAKVLTPENRHEMLPKFFQRSKREAMAMAAALQPATAAPHRDVVTPLRAVPAPGLSETEALSPSTAVTERAVQPVELHVPVVQPVEPRVVPSATMNMATSSATPNPVRRDSAEPLTGDLSRLHITVSRRFLEKLEAARAALSHARPGASAEEILEAGLDLVLKRQAKRKGLVEKPRKESPSTKSDLTGRAPSARSGLEIEAAASGRLNPVASVARLCASSSITGFRAHVEDPRRSTTCDCSAGCTISSRPGAPSATSG